MQRLLTAILQARNGLPLGSQGCPACLSKQAECSREGTALSHALRNGERFWLTLQIPLWWGTQGWKDPRMLTVPFYIPQQRVCGTYLLSPCTCSCLQHLAIGP